MAKITWGFAAPPGNESIQTQHSLPETVTFGIKHQQKNSAGTTIEIWELWYPANPNSTAAFAVCPIGSRVWDVSTPAVWLKTAAAGTNTWVTETLS